mmetsp:Transcript_20263/g.9388  ORF Transcript_20263/g.9388 Transcript_20263/m.9388 type:complete len:228 (+) Transcript_20263:83-766(+)
MPGDNHNLNSKIALKHLWILNKRPHLDKLGANSKVNRSQLVRDKKKRKMWLNKVEGIRKLGIKVQNLLVRPPLYQLGVLQLHSNLLMDSLKSSKRIKETINGEESKLKRANGGLSSRIGEELNLVIHGVLGTVGRSGARVGTNLEAIEAEVEETEEEETEEEGEEGAATTVEGKAIWYGIVQNLLPEAEGEAEEVEPVTSATKKDTWLKTVKQVPNRSVIGVARKDI